MMGFMPHGHCYHWRPEILWPIVIGEAMHVIAYLSLSVMLFYLCTRPLGRVSQWMPPFIFLFACFIFTCAVTHVLNLITIWHPVYEIQSVIMLFSGLVSLLTLLITLLHRKDILIWLGAQESKVFSGSHSYDRHPPKTDCQKCMAVLHDMNDDGGKL